MLSNTTLSSIRAASAAQSRAAILLPATPTTTSSGVSPGFARFDTPPPGSEVAPLERLQRTRKETQLGELWRQELCPKSVRRTQSRTSTLSKPQVSNAGMPPRSMPPPAIPSSSRTAAASPLNSTPPAPQASTKTMHPLSKATTGRSERQEFVENLSRLLGQDCSHLPTQELESMLEAIQDSQETPYAAEKQQAQGETIVHPPQSLNVGGGFHLSAAYIPEPALHGLKRPNSDSSQTSSKRARVTQQDNKDTEDEDDLPSQPPAPPTRSVPPSIATPQSRPSASASPSATSSTKRPVGLPQSSARTRPIGLPISSRGSSTEVQTAIVPPSVSPTPSSRATTVSPRISVPNTRDISQPVDALSVEHISTLLDFALDLAKKKALNAPATSQSPLDNVVNAAYLRAIEDLRTRFQSALQVQPQTLAGQDAPPSLEPYPRLEPLTTVASLPDIVPDNEESLQAIAAAASRTRNKSKPSLRDYTGNIRQILSASTLDLLAYICAEGPYETKRQNLVWALEAFKRTWARELPGVPPEIPDLNALKLVVARASTLRGLARDNVRKIVTFIYGLHCPPRNEAERLENQQIIARALPNAFHCYDISQPRLRQYEHPAIQRALSVALFYSTDAVGAVFHIYFDPMPLPTVAFALTTIQFCLEEWETGTFKAKELRAERQYNTYCAHLRGLQQYDTVASSRLMRFREQWFQFAIQYSGLSIVIPPEIQEVTDAADVRPDTPVEAHESSPDL